MTTPEKMTKAQRMHWNYAVDARRMVEYDLHSVAMKLRCLPPEWDEIWKDKDRRDAKLVPVTIRLDADVVKFFKALGPGYQPRINRVLRSFMHYRLAGIVDGPDTTDYVMRPETLTSSHKQRPTWGEVQRLESELQERMDSYAKGK